MGGPYLLCTQNIGPREQGNKKKIPHHSVQAGGMAPCLVSATFALPDGDAAAKCFFWPHMPCRNIFWPPIYPIFIHELSNCSTQISLSLKIHTIWPCQFERIISMGFGLQGVRFVFSQFVFEINTIFKSFQVQSCRTLHPPPKVWPEYENRCFLTNFFFFQTW